MSKLIKLSLSVKLYIFFIVLFIISALPAFAQVTVYDSVNNFLSSNPGIGFQDFSGATIQDPSFAQACTAPANSSSNDGCFTPGVILPGIQFTATPVISAPVDLAILPKDFLGIGSPPANALVNNFFHANFEIDFDPPVTAAGMTMGCDTNIPAGHKDIIVEVRDPQNILLYSTHADVSIFFNTFFGIQSQFPIGKILLKNSDPTAPDIERSAKGVINIWFGQRQQTVPTLSEWGMIAAAAGLGLVGVFFAVRRRKAAVN